MTDFTPAPTIKLDGVAYTGMVDFNINFTRGQADPYGVPSAGSGSIALLFNDVPSIPVQINSTVEVFLNTVPTTNYVFGGRVTDMNLSAQAYGSAGSLWRLDLTVVGDVAQALNKTYYVAADTTSNTATAIQNAVTALNTRMWEELSSTDTWNDVSATLTWATFDSGVPTMPLTVLNGTGPSVTIKAGYRDPWQDICTLVQGSHSLFIEASGGAVWIYVAPTSAPFSITVPTSALLTDIQAGVSLSDVRNQVSVYQYDDTLGAYQADDISIDDYGIRDGSINTFLNNTGDAANLAGYIIEGLAQPTMQINQFTIDVTNPTLTDVTRYNLANLAFYGLIYNLSGTLPSALGTGPLFALFHTWNITRDQCLLTVQAASQSVFFGSPTWKQISPAYTWTSYGTAYPTQKWSDL